MGEIIKHDFLDVGGLGQHLGRLTPEEKTIRLAAFYRILAGKPASIDELALETGIAASLVSQCVGAMADRGILVTNEHRTVTGSHGLSLIPTDHRLTINGRNIFTWCAADAVGIPAALGMDAVISSRCFLCNTPIQITMSGGEVHYSNQADTRVWVIEADLGRSIVGCA